MANANQKGKKDMEQLLGLSTKTNKRDVGGNSITNLNFIKGQEPTLIIQISGRAKCPNEKKFLDSG